MVANERIHQTNAEPAADRQGRLTWPSSAPATAEQAAFLDALVDAGLLIETGVPGRLRPRRRVRGRPRRRSTTRDRARGRRDGAEPMRFPPLLPRRQLETSGYLEVLPAPRRARSSRSTATRPRRTSSTSARRATRTGASSRR